MGVIVDRTNVFDPKMIVTRAPFEMRGESAVSETMALAAIPREAIQMLRPPLPPIPSPDIMAMPPLTIDVLTGSKVRSWFAQGMRGQGPAPRPQQATQNLSGSARNTMGSVSPYG